MGERTADENEPVAYWEDNRIIAKVNGTVVEGNWQTMQDLAQAIFTETGDKRGVATSEEAESESKTRTGNKQSLSNESLKNFIANGFGLCYLGIGLIIGHQAGYFNGSIFALSLVPFLLLGLYNVFTVWNQS